MEVTLIKSAISANGGLVSLVGCVPQMQNEPERQLQPIALLALALADVQSSTKR